MARPTTPAPASSGATFSPSWDSAFSTTKTRMNMPSTVRSIGSRVRTRALRAAWLSRAAASAGAGWPNWPLSHTTSARTRVQRMLNSVCSRRLPSVPSANHSSEWSPQVSSSSTTAPMPSSTETTARIGGT